MTTALPDGPAPRRRLRPALFLYEHVGKYRPELLKEMCMKSQKCLTIAITDDIARACPDLLPHRENNVLFFEDPHGNICVADSVDAMRAYLVTVK